MLVKYFNCPIVVIRLYTTTLQHEAIQVQKTFFVTIYPNACQIFQLLHCGYLTVYYHLRAWSHTSAKTFFVTIYPNACKIFQWPHCGYQTVYYHLRAWSHTSAKLLLLFIRTLVKYFNCSIVVIRLYTTTLQHEAIQVQKKIFVTIHPNACQIFQ